MEGDFKIYVPDINGYDCYVVRDSNIIRAYENMPSPGSTINYRDYFYKSNYLYQDGSQSFSQYATIPVCLDSSVLTSNYYYRNDFSDILIIFVVICGLPVLLVLKMIKTFFLGRKLY